MAENQSTVATTTEVSMTNQNMVWDISLVADSDKSLLDSTAVSKRDYCLQDHHIISELKPGFNRTNLKANKPELYWLDIFLAKSLKVCADRLLPFLDCQPVCFSGLRLWDFKPMNKSTKKPMAIKIKHKPFM